MHRLDVIQRNPYTAAQESRRMQLDPKRAGMLSIMAALLTPS